MAAVGTGIHEQALLIGRRKSLVTIIARPAHAPRSDEPAVVILNTGIVHRVGHSRMYVTLARTLAKRGRTVVRFDFSGIGDSEARDDKLSPLAASLDDIRQVLEWLETKHGFSRFILMGLCSGADHAVLYGSTDPRVVGLVLLDPTIPPTARYFYHYIRQRLGRPQSWLSLFSGRSSLLRLLASSISPRRSATDFQDLASQGVNNLQFSPYLRQCYARIAGRGTKILAVLTAVSVRHTYAQQIQDAFPEAASRGGFRLEFFSDGDHVFSSEKHRLRLYTAVMDWLGLG